MKRETGDVFKELILTPELEIVIVRESKPRSKWTFPGSIRNQKQPGRVGKRQRAQEHAIHNRKNGCVRSNAERENQNDHGCKTRALAQVAEGIARIVCKGFQG